MRYYTTTSFTEGSLVDHNFQNSRAKGYSLKDTLNAKPLRYFQNKVNFDFKIRKCDVAKGYAILRTGGESIIGFNFSHFWME